MPLASRSGGILLHPVFWLTLVFAGLMIAVPLHGNNVALREDLILVAVAVILASNLNLMIGYTGYVNFGHIVFYGLGGYVGLYLATVRDWNLHIGGTGCRSERQPVGLGIRSRHSTACGELTLRSRQLAFWWRLTRSSRTSILWDVLKECMSPSTPMRRSAGPCVLFGSPTSWSSRVMALSMILSLAIKKSKVRLRSVRHSRRRGRRRGSRH